MSILYDCELIQSFTKDSGYNNILQDKTLFCAFEAGNTVCWLVNPPIAKLDLFKSLDCRWICKTYAEYCYRNLATVRRLVQSPTLQSTIFCGVHNDLRGKGIRVSPAWFHTYVFDLELREDQFYVNNIICVFYHLSGQGGSLWTLKSDDTDSCFELKQVSKHD